MIRILNGSFTILISSNEYNIIWFVDSIESEMFLSLYSRGPRPRSSPSHTPSMVIPPRIPKSTSSSRNIKSSLINLTYRSSSSRSKYPSCTLTTPCTIYFITAPLKRGIRSSSNVTSPSHLFLIKSLLQRRNYSTPKNNNSDNQTPKDTSNADSLFDSFDSAKKKWNKQENINDTSSKQSAGGIQVKPKPTHKNDYNKQGKASESVDPSSIPFQERDLGVFGKFLWLLIFFGGSLTFLAVSFYSNRTPMHQTMSSTLLERGKRSF